MKFRWLALLMSLSLSSTAHAESTAASDSTEPIEVPFARDLVAGHVQVAASAAYAIPFGRLSNDFAHTARAGHAGEFGGEVNYGLDRFVFLGAYGSYTLAGESQPCNDCSGNGWTAGIQFVYHLAQGLRIDPWVSYGLGYRSLKTQDDQGDYSYGGIDWMRLAIGTNWFVSRNFAVSPFGQFSAGTTVVVPQGEKAGGTDLQFQFGLRLLLDLPGR